MQVTGPRRLAGATLAVALLAACGGSDGDSVAAGPQQQKVDPAQADLPTTATDQPATPQRALPDVQVVDVNTGRSANLRTFAVAGKPTLLWFWAPHCTFCRAEAPELLAFAKTYGDRIQVLGLGAQDDLDQAKGFLEDTSTQNLTMVWEAAGRSWLHYKVTNQPTVIVLGADGSAKRTWFRDFDAEGIVKAAGI